ncbi:ABC transporter permease, partial [Klebsiella variicola]|nr:ABC transporter permease [Klebsiella variicola]
LIACGATLLGAILGTLLGFLAAHVRGTVEQAILALVDFQATMPFLILALAILAFIGNSLVIFMGLLALHGWERYAR